MVTFILAILVMNDVISNSNFSHLTLVDYCLVSTAFVSERTRKETKFWIERLIINSVRKFDFRETQLQTSLLF